MKVTEQRMRIKKFYNEGLNPSHNKHSSIGNYNNHPPTSNDGLTGRESTSHDMAFAKSLIGRNDLASAMNHHTRDAVSTRGGMSFIGGRSEFPHDEPPFLILPDQESLSHFMTK
jgi:hypothetical protein